MALCFQNRLPLGRNSRSLVVGKRTLNPLSPPAVISVPSCLRGFLGLGLNLILLVGPPLTSESRDRLVGTLLKRQLLLNLRSSLILPCRRHYPPLNNTVGVGNSSTSFSSVILPSTEFPPLPPESGSSKPRRSEDCSGSYNVVEAVEDDSRNPVLEKLLSLYSWADNSLLEDVMLAVNDDFKRACNLLDVMGSSGTNNADLRFESHNYSIELDPGKSKKDVLFGMGSGSMDSTPSLDSCSNEKNRKPTGKSNFSRDSTCDIADIQYMLERLKSVPLEPELVENDMYLNHRRNAIKKMRSAARSSRAATNCFLRGDHFSAQQHSFRARQEWSAAEKLNVRAAKEILSTRNVENDIWKLDLHGLHAAEAVQVLQEHLWKIETQVPLKHFISSSRVKTMNGITDSVSSESFGSVGMQLDRNLLPTKHSPMSLEVITGRGNHSRGQASLPSAIKTFLHDNRYRFDDGRPGMITVRPKFRVNSGC